MHRAAGLAISDLSFPLSALLVQLNVIDWKERCRKALDGDAQVIRSLESDCAPFPFSLFIVGWSVEKTELTTRAFEWETRTTYLGASERASDYACCWLPGGKYGSILCKPLSECLPSCLASRVI